MSEKLHHSSDKPPRITNEGLNTYSKFGFEDFNDAKYAPVREAILSKINANDWDKLSESKKKALLIEIDESAALAELAESPDPTDEELERIAKSLMVDFEEEEPAKDLTSRQQEIFNLQRETHKCESCKREFGLDSINREGKCSFCQYGFLKEVVEKKKRLELLKKEEEKLTPGGDSESSEPRELDEEDDEDGFPQLDPEDDMVGEGEAEVKSTLKMSFEDFDEDTQKLIIEYLLKFVELGKKSPAEYWDSLDDKGQRRCYRNFRIWKEKRDSLAEMNSGLTHLETLLNQSDPVPDFDDLGLFIRGAVGEYGFLLGIVNAEFNKLSDNERRIKLKTILGLKKGEKRRLEREIGVESTLTEEVKTAELPEKKGNNTYSYEAMDTAGGADSGTVEANSEEEAYKKIRSLGIFPTKVTLTHENGKKLSLWRRVFGGGSGSKEASSAETKKDREAAEAVLEEVEKLEKEGKEVPKAVKDAAVWAAKGTVKVGGYSLFAIVALFWGIGFLPMKVALDIGEKGTIDGKSLDPFWALKSSKEK